MVTKNTTPPEKAASKRTTKKIASEYTEPTPVKKPRTKKVSGKAEATAKKQPWVGVLETHVNPDNPANGFFELDWNEYFVLKLKQEGYGVDDDPEEEIVDRWFRELCANVVVDGDYGGAVKTGTIDINSVKKNNQ